MRQGTRSSTWLNARVDRAGLSSKFAVGEKNLTNGQCDGNYAPIIVQETVQYVAEKL